MNTATKPSFNYESFDRQMEGFLSMSYLMIDEWDECTSEEMTSDLYSLCIKGARLCNMIDTDLALQQQDLTQSRHGKNQDYYLRLNEIMRPLSELIFKAMDERSTDGFLTADAQVAGPAVANYRRECPFQRSIRLIANAFQCHRE